MKLIVDKLEWIRFPAEHDKFYEEYAYWKSEIYRSNNEINCVYLFIANKSIKRIFNTDKLGILYIGEGYAVHKLHRLGKLINAINGTGKRHPGGKRFYELFYDQKFKLKNCELLVHLTKDNKAIEGNLLSKYEKIYGELPPLNRMKTG